MRSFDIMLVFKSFGCGSVKNKYIIALIPTTVGDQILDLANGLLPIADQYCLGKKSIPHVTLCQFMAAPSDLAQIWSEVAKSLVTHSLVLSFKEFSCISIHNLFWVSLLPQQHTELCLMHEAIIKHLTSPLKKTFDYYDPHMTLINTQDIHYQDQVNALTHFYVPIHDTFIVTLGKADAIGQMTEIIFSI
jgi:2'-5' RNA ligase